MAFAGLAGCDTGEDSLGGESTLQPPATAEALPAERVLPAPPEIGDGWPTAAPADVGLNEAPLLELLEMLERQAPLNMHAVLVVKDGRLVFEEYFEGTDADIVEDVFLGSVPFDRETLHDLRSVTKSVTSALVGIAQAEGVVPGVDASLGELFPNRDVTADKDLITLRNVLSMSAGLQWDEWSTRYGDLRNSWTQMSKSQDPVGFVLDQPVRDAPGSTYAYSGGLTTLLADLIERASGQSIAEYARESLFEPLGVTEFEWATNDNGSHDAASGLRLAPRDLAKFGSLYLNGGQWQGRQVLPRDWVEQSIQSHSMPTETVGYGYQWWIAEFASDDRSMEVALASGNGGQVIYVISELELLVVMNAGHYNSNSPTHRLLQERLLGEFVLAAAGFVDAEFVDE